MACVFDEEVNDARKIEPEYEVSLHLSLPYWTSLKGLHKPVSQPNKTNILKHLSGFIA